MDFEAFINARGWHEEREKEREREIERERERTTWYFVTDRQTHCQYNHVD